MIPVIKQEMEKSKKIHTLIIITSSRSSSNSSCCWIGSRNGISSRVVAYLTVVELPSAAVSTGTKCSVITA